MTNKDLIKQYLDTGLQLPEYQVNKLSDNLKKTYLRKRLIAIEASDYNELDNYEYDLLSPEQKFEYALRLYKRNVHKYSNDIEPNNYEEALKYYSLDKYVNDIKDYLNDDEKSYNLILGELLRIWGRKAIDIPMKMFNSLNETLLEEYSNLYFRSAFYYRTNMSHKSHIIKRASKSINEMVKIFENNKQYLIDSFVRMFDKSELTATLFLEIFMNNKNFINMLTGEDLGWILLNADDEIKYKMLKLYLSNGGSIDVIKSNKHLSDFMFY